MAFEGKVILITGASSGIGAACAEHFAKEGALLALVGRNPEKFEIVLENIEKSGVELEPLVIYADVTVDAERIMNETIEKYERLDILINNAGTSISGTIETMKMEDYDTVFATNLRSMFQLTQLATPHLIETKGNVVNVSSIGGVRVFPNMVVYCMTKAAVNQFTRCVAMDLAEKGVRVNTVSPALINTEFILHNGIERDQMDECLETLGMVHPIKRVGTTMDCVNAIAFLANDENSFVTGTSLLIDGGLDAKSPFV